MVLHACEYKWQDLQIYIVQGRTQPRRLESLNLEEEGSGQCYEINNKHLHYNVVKILINKFIFR